MVSVRFFYNSLRQLFPNAKLPFPDTDFLCVSIRHLSMKRMSMNNCVKKTFLLDNGIEVAASSLFHFSNYPREHPCHSLANIGDIVEVKKLNGIK